MSWLPFSQGTPFVLECRRDLAKVIPREIAVDVSELSKLGKVAGVPGIAIGAVVLVIGASLALTDTLPPGWHGPVLMASIIGILILGGIALLGWSRGNRAGAQIARTEGNNSPAINIDKTKTAGAQTARTAGANAPATNQRG